MLELGTVTVSQPGSCSVQAVVWDLPLPSACWPGPGLFLLPQGLDEGWKIVVLMYYERCGMRSWRITRTEGHLALARRMAVGTSGHCTVEG